MLAVAGFWIRASSRAHAPMAERDRVDAALRTSQAPVSSHHGPHPGFRLRQGLNGRYTFINCLPSVDRRKKKPDLGMTPQDFLSGGPRRRELGRSHRHCDQGPGAA
jgi:hypothetical protein